MKSMTFGELLSKKASQYFTPRSWSKTKERDTIAQGTIAFRINKRKKSVLGGQVIKYHHSLLKVVFYYHKMVWYTEQKQTAVPAAQEIECEFVHPKATRRPAIDKEIECQRTRQGRTILLQYQPKQKNYSKRRDAFEMEVECLQHTDGGTLLLQAIGDTETANDDNERALAIVSVCTKESTREENNEPSPPDTRQEEMKARKETFGSFTSTMSSSSMDATSSKEIDSDVSSIDSFHVGSNENDFQEEEEEQEACRFGCVGVRCDPTLESQDMEEADISNVLVMNNDSVSNTDSSGRDDSFSSSAKEKELKSSSMDKLSTSETPFSDKEAPSSTADERQESEADTSKSEVVLDITENEVEAPLPTIVESQVVSPPSKECAEQTPSTANERKEEAGTSRNGMQLKSNNTNEVEAPSPTIVESQVVSSPPKACTQQTSKDDENGRKSQSFDVPTVDKDMATIESQIPLSNNGSKVEPTFSENETQPAQSPTVCPLIVVPPPPTKSHLSHSDDVDIDDGIRTSKSLDSCKAKDTDSTPERGGNNQASPSVHNDHVLPTTKAEPFSLDTSVPKDGVKLSRSAKSFLGKGLRRVVTFNGSSGKQEIDSSFLGATPVKRSATTKSFKFGRTKSVTCILPAVDLEATASEESLDLRSEASTKTEISTTSEEYTGAEMLIFSYSAEPQDDISTSESVTRKSVALDGKPQASPRLVHPPASYTKTLEEPQSLALSCTSKSRRDICHPPRDLPKGHYLI